MKRARSRLTRSSRVRLVVLLGGRRAGEVHQIGNGRLVFRYEDSWRADPRSYPLSLSMPLAGVEHGDRAIRAYLWGLLPDNPNVLEWWARRYGVSPHRVVDLLVHVGEDVAGAVQLVSPERADAFTGVATETDERSLVTWLDDGELAQRLRDLRLNPAAGRVASDTGQFSLAGTQPKTALYQSADGRWGVPRGRMPTNRILKPPTLGLDDLAYNEHFCLLLARALGVLAAQSTVERFDDEVAIVVHRFDRYQHRNRLLRVHQEDMCQALAVLPTRKYENEGGPGASAIAGLLRQYSNEAETDVWRFVDALALNWLIGGTDAHAKNYAILHAIGPQVRLAPLYDVITILPYAQRSTATLAMAIGGERSFERISAEHWVRFAKGVGADAGAVLDRVRTLAQRIPEALVPLADQDHGDERTRDLIARFGTRVTDHATTCLARL